MSKGAPGHELEQVHKCLPGQESTRLHSSLQPTRRPSPNKRRPSPAHLVHLHEDQHVSLLFYVQLGQPLALGAPGHSHLLDVLLQPELVHLDGAGLGGGCSWVSRSGSGLQEPSGRLISLSICMHAPTLFEGVEVLSRAWLDLQTFLARCSHRSHWMYGMSDRRGLALGGPEARAPVATTANTAQISSRMAFPEPAAKVMHGGGPRGK